jgi:hypothetical protein
VLVALEEASTCKRRHALLLRAKNAGDERVLAVLQTYEKTDGCGKKQDEDCNACMREDEVLKNSITEMKKRLGK